MSLSRILNDEPTGHQPTSVPTAIDPPQMASPTPSSPAPSGSQQSLGAPSDRGPVEQPPQPRGMSYQPSTYEGAGGFNPYTGDWVQGDIFPLGRGGNYYTDRAREHEEAEPNGDGVEDTGVLEDGTRQQNGHSESHGRTSKRRKVADQQQQDTSEQAPAKRVRDYILRAGQD